MSARIQSPAHVAAGTGRWSIGHPHVAWPAIAVAIVLSLAVVVRIAVQYQEPGPFDVKRQGMCDFQNGIYFPAMALLDGVSPYGTDYATRYPVPRPIPFFSPGILALHAPLTLLHIKVAGAIFIVLNFTWLLWLAAIAASAAGLPRRVDAVAVIAAAMLMSRAGHITMFTGYFTLELVIATYLAIHWGGRSPWKAAVSLAIVSAKPTYVLPIGFLMLARGNVRALVYGGVLSIVFAAVPFAYLAHHQSPDGLVEGGRELIRQIEQTQRIHRQQVDESPLLSWTRLDLLAVVAKWFQAEPGDAVHLIGMMFILAVPMGLLWVRRRRGIDDGLGGLTGTLIVLASLVSVYHQSYDSLLLTAPIAAVAVRSVDPWKRLTGPARWVLLSLLLLPCFNYFSTRLFLVGSSSDMATVKIMTSLSGLALAQSLGMLVLWGGWLLWRDTADGRPAGGV